MTASLELSRPDAHAATLDTDRYRAVLVAELAAQRRTVDDCNAEVTALADHSDHEAVDTRFAIRSERAQALDAIDQLEQALGRLANGTFGFCDHCRAPIGDARLDALPTARLCIGCASR
jgi:RNA polymerase-binding transcription factor DksA